MKDFLEFKWSKVRAEFEELCRLYDQLQVKMGEINKKKAKCLKEFEKMRKLK